MTNCANAEELMAALAGGGTVSIICTGLIPLPETLSITVNTTIETTNAATGLSGGSNVRIIRVLSGATLTLSNITLMNGRQTAANGTSGANGQDDRDVGRDAAGGTSGEEARGGAILNEGGLILLNCTITGNVAVGGNGGTGGNGGSGSFQGGNGGHGGSGGRASGGAIYSWGTLLLSNCTMRGNQVLGGNGGAGGDAGTGAFPGIRGEGGRGGAAEGAGLFNGGTAAIVNCTFADNIAFGGDTEAASNEGGRDVGQDGQPGGHAFGGGILNSGSIRTLNSTFATNQVVGGSGGMGGSGNFQGGDGGNGGDAIGGALYNSGSAAITNSTIALNGAFGGTNGMSGEGPFAGEDGDFGLEAGANLANSGGALVLKNSIVGQTLSGSSISGPVDDAGHNLSAVPVGFSGPGSLDNTDPKLLALLNRGGPTETMGLDPDSPALDAADDSACPPFDQRGRTRPEGVRCDMGAFELPRAAVILAHPQSQTVATGSNVTFSVTVGGQGPFTYQWQFNQADIPGATGSSYNILSARTTNAGIYGVTISSPNGTVSSSNASLTVLGPAITSHPMSQTVTQGGTATFSVTATGAPPVTYQWEFNGADIPGAVNDMLTLMNVQPADAGNYTARVTDSFGSVRSGAAVLQLLVPPVISTQPVSQTVTQGQAVTFTVTASGTTPLFYQWRMDGNNISGATTAAHSIPNAQATNAGAYSVFVSNSAGSTTSSDAVLRVLVPPGDLQATVTNGMLTINVQSAAGLNYTLQSTASLVAPIVWTDVATQAGTGGVLTFSIPASGAMQYLRVRVD